jgi:ATP-dependent DNA ligase
MARLDQDLPDHMLLENMSEAEAKALLTNPEWCFQLKANGHRVRVTVHNGKVRGMSRQNLGKASPMVIVDYLAKKFPDTTVVLDGELLDTDEMVVFDILNHDGNPVHALPAFGRIQIFEKLFPLPPKGAPRPPVVATFTAYTAKAKSAMWSAAFSGGEEGIVAKKNVRYTAGRPSGGPARKYKFLNTCTVICLGQTKERSKSTGADKRSVNVGFYKGRALGHVSIPPNKPIPPTNAPIEVSYQDVLEDGHLYVAVFLGVRDDIPVSDCTEAKQKLYVRGTVRD